LYARKSSKRAALKAPVKKVSFTMREKTTSGRAP